ncbi:sensory rhodopsin transducer [Sphingomonas sp.]|uniref:sensory rhodopsin transducer n=1 Tax=Sphingomonas sp. TaxID=28214 RepID=UPI003CC5F0D5
MTIGRTEWAIPEGFIPSESVPGAHRPLLSHEAACILNAGELDAQIEIMLYFVDREPVGPYRLTVPARRTFHQRFNELTDPAPVPRDTDYASIITSTVPIVVQHTRLDSRQAQFALMSTMAFSG